MTFDMGLALKTCSMDLRDRYRDPFNPAIPKVPLAAGIGHQQPIQGTTKLYVKDGPDAGGYIVVADSNVINGVITIPSRHIKKGKRISKVVYRIISENGVLVLSAAR